MALTPEQLKEKNRLLAELKKKREGGQRSIEEIASAAEKRKGQGISQTGPPLAVEQGPSGEAVVSAGGKVIKQPKRTETITEEEPSFDFEEQFRKLQEAQTAAQVSGLKKSRESQLAALAGQEAEIAPRFQEARRGAITEAQRGARSFGQFLAQRGLAGSGAGAQGELAQTVAKQQQLGGLREEEAGRFADIARGRTGVEQTFARDVATAEAGGQAQLLQNLIQQQNIERQLGVQQEQFAQQQELARAGLTGELGGQQTLAGRAAAQSAQLFEAQKAQIDQSLRAGEISNEQAQFALDQARDPNSVQNRANQVALQIAEMNLEFLPQQQQLQLQQLRKSIAQIGARPVISEQQRRQNELNLQIMEETLKQMQAETGLIGQPEGVDVGTLQAGIQTGIGQLTPGGFDDVGTAIVTAAQQKAEAAAQIVNAVSTGALDPNTASGASAIQDLMIRNNLSEADIENAVKQQSTVTPTGTFLGR